MSADQASVSHRRKVLEIIESLCDSVDKKMLADTLPYLHATAWDEVVEERYVNKNCGYPTCSRPARPASSRQTYHIDRIAGKIFEYCADRHKFCTEQCFKKSVKIREQLPEEAVWITGAEPNLKREFEIPEDTGHLITEIEQPKPRLRPKRVEVVEDKIVASLSNLKIREEDTDIVSDNEEEDEELKHVLPYERTKDDEDFMQSVQNFVRSRTQSKTVQPPPVPMPSSEKDEAILEKLRQKYNKNNRATKKGPIMIEPVGFQPEHTKIEEKCAAYDIEWLLDLLKIWITPETRQLIKNGGRSTNLGINEQKLMEFLSGKVNKEEESGVDLPTLDKFNIKEKRLNIFTNSIKHNWLELEAKLQLTSTRKDLLARIAATFHLDSDNITGWDKKGSYAIVIAMFLLACLTDVELEDDYIQHDNISPELVVIASDLCAIDSVGLSKLYSFLSNQSKC